MDYDLIVVKTLERVYKNYYYIIRGEFLLTFVKNTPANSHLKALYKSPSLQYIFDTKYMIHAAFKLVNYAEISNLVRPSIPRNFIFRTSKLSWPDAKHTHQKDRCLFTAS